MNYLTGKHIIEPLVADDLKNFRGLNQYSALVMSFGYQFITDPKYIDRKAPQDIMQAMGEEQPSSGE